MQGTDVTIEDRYELSADGKTLTITRKIGTTDDSFAVKIVMAKKS